MDPSTQHEVLEFWLGDSEPDFKELERRITLWFEAAPEVDADIASRFETAFQAARNGELDEWKTTARGRLALIILLDQFSRTLYRENERAFLSDAEALRICLEGIELGLDAELSILERAFFYMPMQHAERTSAQDKSVRVFEELASSCPEAIRPQMLRFLASARSHRNIVEKFGRFPHRNRVLGRQCTQAENEFLTIGTVPFRQKA